MNNVRSDDALDNSKGNVFLLRINYKIMTPIYSQI